MGREKQVVVLGCKLRVEKGWGGRLKSRKKTQDNEAVERKYLSLTEDVD